MMYRKPPSWLVIVFAWLCLFFVPVDDARAEFKRGYVDTHIGQVHFYRATPDGGAVRKTPIVFFHASPRSGLLYEKVVKEMGHDRVAIAIDTPGFGGSDPFPSEPSMSDIATVMAEAIEGLGYGDQAAGKVDIFGFHTGSLTATELALKRPDLVRRTVIGGIPLRSKDERAVYFKNVSVEPIDEKKVEYAWASMMEFRGEGVTYEEAAVQFAENVRALAGPYWYVYHAVWNYPLEDRIRELQGPTIVLNYPEDTEYVPTLDAFQNYLKNARYAELPEITNTYHPFNPKQNWLVWSNALRTWLDAPFDH